MRRAVLIILVALFALCALAPRGECAIHPIDSIAQVEVDGHTLVVLDIDDTLLYYPYHLGSEIWFREAWQEINAQPNAQARAEATARFHAIAGLLAEKLTPAPVEEITASQVAYWQEMGLHVMAITARALQQPALDDWQGMTIEQLDAIGVSFRFSAPVSAQLDTPRPSSYRDGVLFSASNNKGVALSLLIEQMEVPPSRVVLIDDRISDLEDAEAALEEAGIPFCGFLYQAQEARYTEYSSLAAAEQLHALLAGEPVPSNEAARQTVLQRLADRRSAVAVELP